MSALGGVRVLSLGHTLPGLYCIAVLRDLGAAVTRVEPPAGAGAAERFAGLAGQFPTASLVAGTARCTIDLRRDEGRALVRRLARAAHVVLEGFRPGTAMRLGIDHAALAAENPALVHVAISGYGQDGPARARVGHDIGYLADAGVLELTGDPQGPPVVPGVPVADGLAGMSAAINVLAALRTGHGQFVDCAIVDGPLFLMAMELEHWWRTGAVRRRGDTHLTGSQPWYHVFETRDGRHLAVGAVEPRFYANLCRLIGHPELADAQYAEDEERPALFRLFADVFRTRTRDEWMALLGDDDACVAPVLTPGEAAEAPHAARVRRAVPGLPTPLVRSPVRLAPAPLDAPATLAETLAAYAIPPEETRRLEVEGVVSA